MRKVAFLVANDTFPKDPSIPPLRFTQNDARELAKVLEDRETCGFETRVYLNRPSQEVLTDLDQVSGEVGQEDTLLFYYSGHGKLRGNELCLVSNETTTTSLGATSIRTRLVLEYLQGSLARRRILILDCCHSGAIGRVYKAVDSKSTLDGLADSFGSYILTASTSIELAEERERDGHGVFTKALIDCLREGPKDRITINDLYEYAHARLKIFAQQTPLFWALQQEGTAVEIGNYQAKHERERQRKREQVERERQLERARLERERQLERERLISTARVKFGPFVAVGELDDEQVESVLRLLECNETRLLPHDRRFREDVIRFLKGEAKYREVFGAGHIPRPEPAPKPPADEVSAPITPAEALCAEPSLTPPVPVAVEEPVSLAEPPVGDQPIVPEHEAPLGLTGDGAAVEEPKWKRSAREPEAISTTRTLFGVGLALAVTLLGGLFYLDSMKKSPQPSSTSNGTSVEPSQLSLPSAKPLTSTPVSEKPIPSAEPAPPNLSSATNAQAFQTSAPHAILIDSATQSMLFEKDADALVVPASTVKIMTAEIVFHEIALGHLKLDDQFVVSETAWRYGGAPARGSSMFAALNSSVRVEDLIRGLVIVSGNDAAIALAEGIAGSEGAFATLMMKRARELGLARSTFTNAWGRGDPDQKVSPREMAALANHVILTYPELYKYFGEKDFTWNKIKQPNRNPLLTMGLGADGLKTGNIDLENYDIVASAVQNGQRLTLALYGCRTAKERVEEARKIFLWGFSGNRPRSRNEIPGVQ